MGGLTSRAIARKRFASEASSRPKYYSAPSRTYSDVEQETQVEIAIRPILRGRRSPRSRRRRCRRRRVRRRRARGRDRRPPPRSRRRGRPGIDGEAARLTERHVVGRWTNPIRCGWDEPSACSGYPLGRARRHLRLPVAARRRLRDGAARGAVRPRRRVGGGERRHRARPRGRARAEGVARGTGHPARGGGPRGDGGAGAHSAEEVPEAGVPDVSSTVVLRRVPGCSWRRYALPRMEHAFLSVTWLQLLSRWPVYTENGCSGSAVAILRGDGVGEDA